MKHRLKWILSTLACFFGACQSTAPPNSGLITRPLKEDKTQSCFSAIWYSPQADKVLGKHKLVIYIAPVDIKLIEKHHPEEAPIFAKDFRNALYKQINLLGNTPPHAGKRWHCTLTPTDGALSLRLAITRVKPTAVGETIPATVAALALPIPGLSMIVSRALGGSLSIDGALSSANGTPLVQFQATNRAPITLFSVKSFEKYAFNKEELDELARDIARIFLHGSKGEIRCDTDFSLNPF